LFTNAQAVPNGNGFEIAYLIIEERISVIEESENYFRYWYPRSATALLADSKIRAQNSIANFFITAKFDGLPNS